MTQIDASKFSGVSVKRTDGTADLYTVEKDMVTAAYADGDQLVIEAEGEDVIAVYAAHAWMNFELQRGAAA